jgi:hypothetical protein
MSLDPAIKMRYVKSLSEFNPRSFHDEYIDRVKQPRVYLDAVGIDFICEAILNGFSPKEIARQLNIPQTIMLKWIQADDEKYSYYRWALEQEADNQMYDARDKIDNAPLISEAISKASKQAEHRRYMAKGLGPSRWGNKVDVNQNTTATLSYNFNIALDASQRQKVIEGESKRIDESADETLNMDNLIGPGLNVLDFCIPNEGMGYEEARAQETETDEKEQSKESSDTPEDS